MQPQFQPAATHTAFDIGWEQDRAGNWYRSVRFWGITDPCAVCGACNHTDRTCPQIYQTEWDFTFRESTESRPMHLTLAAK